MVLAWGLAAALVLAQGDTGAACRRNQPGDVPGKTQPPPPEQPATPDPESVAYRADLPPLTPPGTMTYEEAAGLDPLAIRDDALGVVAEVLAAADPADRYFAVDAMVQVPWQYARPMLEKALEDPDPQVVLLALQRLSFQADPATVPVLEKYLAWDDLWMPNVHHPSALWVRDSFEADASPIEMLARLRHPAVEAVIREKLTARDENGGLLITANIQGVRLAERYGAKEFLDELAELFNADPNSSVPYHAARVLVQANLNRDQAARALKRGLSSESLMPKVVVSAWAKDIGDKSWEQELRALLTAPEGTLRGQALEALGLLKLPVSDTELEAIIADPDARGRAFDRIEQWADPAVAIPLIEQAVPPSDPGFQQALFAMAKLGSTSALELLKAMTQEREAGGWTRQAVGALNALAELNDPAVVPFLEELLNDPATPFRVQFGCLQGLGRHHRPSSLPALVRYYRNYRTAQPGTAAWAAAIAITLADPTLVPSQEPGRRLIWPVPSLGRYEALYKDREARS